MKPSSSSLWPGALGFTGRAALTVVVIFMLLVALNMVIQVHRMLLDSARGVSLPPPYAGKPAPAALDTSVRPFWPEFPHNSGGVVQSSVINGIQVITEQWNCGAGPDEVLSYYREQMTASGWEDATKQTYNLQPELKATPEDAEKQQYVSSYREVTDSIMVFNRGDWTLRISTEPAKEGFHQLTVRFYAAKTASIMDIAEQATASFSKTLGRNQQPLDSVQKNGREDYHTTMSTVNKPSKDAFRDALADAASKGWRPVLFKQRPQGYFAWLVKGKQYGALSVMDVPPGVSSTVTLIEVTPK